jgi:hypothetical protein
MRGNLLIVAAILLPLVTSAAHAGSDFESSKLSPGVVLQGAALQSSKLSTGVVLQGAGLKSSRLSSGVVLQNSSFQSSKISIGIILEAAKSGGVIPRAPLTHW